MRVTVNRTPRVVMRVTVNRTPRVVMRVTVKRTMWAELDFCYLIAIEFDA